MVLIRRWLAAAALSAGLAGAAVGDTGRVTGVAIALDALALPPGAVFEAVLRRADGAGDPAGVSRVETREAGGPPYRFVLRYDPAEIDPGQSYTVQAAVRAGGELRLKADGAVVLSESAGAHVELELVAADGSEPGAGWSQAAGDGASASGRAERPRGRGIGLALPSLRPRARDLPGSLAAVAADGMPPLRGMVRYMADAAVFAECGTGRAYPIAVESDYEALEHAYLAAAGEPGGPLLASFEGRIDERPAADGGAPGEAVVVERFVGIWPDETCQAVVADAVLVDASWQITRLLDLDLQAADHERLPTLSFHTSQGPRFSATVGCNMLAGAFALEMDRLTFGSPVSTRMACPPPLAAWEQALAEALNRAATWRRDGERLELFDAAGTQVATFEALLRG